MRLTAPARGREQLKRFFGVRGPRFVPSACRVRSPLSKDQGDYLLLRIVFLRLRSLSASVCGPCPLTPWRRGERSGGHLVAAARAAVTAETCPLPPPGTPSCLSVGREPCSLSAEAWAECSRFPRLIGRPRLLLTTPTMSSFSESALEKKLSELSNSQQSVQTLSLWLIHHRKHAGPIVSVWHRELRKGDHPHPWALPWVCSLIHFPTPL